jgi:hypothetical protein
MAAFRKMVSMELDDESKLDAVMPIPMPNRPDFPYGLRICLTEKELDKLGIAHDEAEVGAIFHGHFMARVTSVSQNEGDMGKSCRIEAQIEDLAIESEDAENDDEE